MALSTGDLSSAARGAGRLGYQPALDGLRALALVGIVAYHAGIDILPGGFLGVSSFFTLSGFLITTLLLQEQRRAGRIDLMAFWGRRMRRLLPALLVVVAVVGVTTPLWGDPSQIARLGADGVASIFYVANWWFIAEGDSYGALFQSPSPLRHVWSLAVEEQFYFLFPPVFVALLAVARRRFLLPAVALVTLVAAALPAVLHEAGRSVDRLYFGTDTRLAELMVGVLLATWWSRSGAKTPRSSTGLTAAGVAALVGLGWMWATAGAADAWLYRGGFVVHAGLTAVVIMAALAEGGPIRRVFAIRPAVRLGVLSYGAYLIHWPIVLWLQQSTGLGPWARFALVLAFTIPLAALSYRFVEQPVRELPPQQRRRSLALFPAGAMVAALLLVVSALGPDDPASLDFQAAQDEFDRLVRTGAQPVAAESPAGDASAPAPRASPADPGPATGGDTAAPSGDPSQPAPAPPADVVVLGEVQEPPPRVAVFGDSTSLITGLGLASWALGTDQAVAADGSSALGCGLLPVHARLIEGAIDEKAGDCGDPAVKWPQLAAQNQADVAVIQVGAWEVHDQQLSDGGPFLSLTDPELETMLLDQMIRVTDGLLETVELVVFVANPDVGAARIETAGGDGPHPEYDPARMEAFRSLQSRVATADKRIVIAALDQWIADRDDARLRPDGVHFSWETATEVAREWLGPEILDRWDARSR
jgi:peptidoglycan/LPS O-acetylase OafA/YrhL/lysophospholipase L1-like esterase